MSHSSRQTQRIRSSRQPGPRPAATGQQDSHQQANRTPSSSLAEPASAGKQDPQQQAGRNRRTCSSRQAETTGFTGTAASGKQGHDQSAGKQEPDGLKW